MQTPLDDKLSSDVAVAAPQASAKKIKEELAPVTLNPDEPKQAEPRQEETKAENSSQPKNDDSQYLKSTVSTTTFVPKGPIGPQGTVLPSKSITSGKTAKLTKNKNGSLMDNAKAVNLMPVPLMESEAEIEQKVESEAEQERKQLAELWEAALTRSPEIQFVVQKLMPTSEPGRATTVMMRMLGSVMLGGAGAISMMSPNPMSYMGTQMGASMIMNVLNMQESKAAKNAKVSQQEAILLFTMIRQQADKLVASYRHYKTDLSILDKATKDLSDLQSMVAEARGGQDAAKQVEMEYTIRKAQRDADKLADEIRLSRQTLVDLAGNDAVSKLDRELSGPFPVAATLNKDKPI